MRRARILVLCTVAALVSGCDDDSIPSGDPGKQVTTKIRGHHAQTGVGIDGAARPFWIQQAVSGYDEKAAIGMPAALSSLRLTNGCRPPRPEAGSIVASVVIPSVLRYTSLYSISQDSIAAAAETLIKVKRSKKKQSLSDSELAASTEDRFDVVDVIVTEQSAPVHLVLSGGSTTVWNILTSEGASVSGATLLGGEVTGIANLPPTAKVAALDAKALERCRISPLREPQPHWKLHRNLASMSNGKEILAENIADARAYDAWLSSALGTPKLRAGAGMTSHVLVGPMPAKDRRVPWRSIEGASVAVWAPQPVAAMTHEAYRAQKLEAAKTLAERMIGAPLESLKPTQ